MVIANQGGTSKNETGFIHTVSGSLFSAGIHSLLSAGGSLFDRRSGMPEVTVERRSAPRYAMVLAAEVIELPRGAKLSARTADISRTGCYIDTLNPIPPASRVLVRITHHDESFEAEAEVVYVSYGLGMGVAFSTCAREQMVRLERWLAEAGNERQTA
jgi:Ribonuclease G/E